MISRHFLQRPFGILVMIFASPSPGASIAFDFGPAELFSIMLLGLLAGGHDGQGARPLKGVAMTVTRPAVRHCRHRRQQRRACASLSGFIHAV